MVSIQITSDATPEIATAALATAASNPKVLVLLAAYNGARWIGEQVDSILAQESVAIALVIRDDGSTDGTLQELERFSGDVRVSRVCGSVPTGSAAGNFLKLIHENDAAGFDFIAFADQDDLWDSDKVLRGCQKLAAEGAAGYSSATLAVWEDGRRVVLHPSGAPSGSDFLFEGAGQGCTFVMTAAFYRLLRGLLSIHSDLTRNLHYHDWAIYALARAWGLRWCFDPHPSMQYRQHVGNDTGARGTLGGITRRLTLVRQGWYREQLLGISELCFTATPENPAVAAWHHLLRLPDSWHRRWRIVSFCMGGGRRRRRDNAIVVLAALAGWV